MTSIDIQKIHEGDILFGDFGYSMTLPAFYLVTKVTPSGKSARVRRLATTNVTNDGGWTGTCVPDMGNFREDGDQMYRIKKARWDKRDPFEYVTIRDHYFRVWDGEPAYFDHWD